MTNNQSIVRNDPTFDVIAGGVYEVIENKNPTVLKELIIVESFTAYDSEGKLLGNANFPIYHAIVRLITELKNSPMFEQSNLRLSPEFIATNCNYIGVSFIK